MTNWTFEDYYLLILGICAVNKFYQDWLKYREVRKKYG
jgi:hypothetical protein